MKHHPEYGELFPEWRLFESARSAYNFLSKRKDLFDKLVKRFQDTVDFLNPRLNSSVTLQNLVHCFNTVGIYAASDVWQSRLRLRASLN